MAIPWLAKHAESADPEFVPSDFAPLYTRRVGTLDRLLVTGIVATTRLRPTRATAHCAITRRTEDRPPVHLLIAKQTMRARYLVRVAHVFAAACVLSCRGSETVAPPGSGRANAAPVVAISGLATSSATAVSAMGSAASGSRLAIDSTAPSLVVAMDSTRKALGMAVIEPSDTQQLVVNPTSTALALLAHHPDVYSSDSAVLHANLTALQQTPCFAAYAAAIRDRFARGDSLAGVGLDSALTAQGLSCVSETSLSQSVVQSALRAPAAVLLQTRADNTPEAGGVRVYTEVDQTGAFEVQLQNTGIRRIAVWAYESDCSGADPHPVVRGVNSSFAGRGVADNWGDLGLEVGRLIAHGDADGPTAADDGLGVGPKGHKHCIDYYVIGAGFTPGETPPAPIPDIDWTNNSRSVVAYAFMPVIENFIPDLKKPTFVPALKTLVDKLSTTADVVSGVKSVFQANHGLEQDAALIALASSLLGLVVLLAGVGGEIAAPTGGGLITGVVATVLSVTLVTPVVSGISQYDYSLLTLPRVSHVRIVAPTASVTIYAVSGTPLQVGGTAIFAADAFDDVGNPAPEVTEFQWSTPAGSGLTLANTTGSQVSVKVSRAGSFDLTATIGQISNTFTVDVGQAPSQTKPTIVLDQPALTLSTTVGSTAAAQIVNVTNGGTGTLSGLAVSGTVYRTGEQTGWVTPSWTNGTTAPATLSLAYGTASLAAGTYHASVSITSSAAGVTNTPQTLTITLTVKAAASAPRIALDQTTLTPSGVQGQGVAAQTVNVTNSGTGALDGLAVGTIQYGSGEPTGWITPNWPSGTVAPAVLALDYSTNALPVGVYHATVPVVSSASGVVNSPLSFAVQLTITTGTPAITLNPNTANFADTLGGAAPSSQSIIAVTNTGTGGTLNGLTVGTITYRSGESSGWLTTAALSAATAPATLTLGVSPVGLGAGTYHASVPIASSAQSVTNSPQTVSVVLTVVAMPNINNVSTTPNPPTASVQFTVNILGTNFDPQTAQLVFLGPGCPGLTSCVVPSNVLTTKTTGAVSGPARLSSGSFTVQVQNGAGGAISNIGYVHVP